MAQKYSLSAQSDYVRLNTWGKLHVADVEDPATAAIVFAQEHGLSKLLDDIRNVDSSNVPMDVQLKGVGVLWKLTTFKKVAILVAPGELSSIFVSTLRLLHIKTKIKGFEDETAAILWLAQDD